MLSDWFKRTLVVIIAIIGVVVVTTSIMGFIGVPPNVYNPYMYFTVAMAILAIFLSPQPSSILL